MRVILQLVKENNVLKAIKGSSSFFSRSPALQESRWKGRSVSRREPTPSIVVVRSSPSDALAVIGVAVVALAALGVFWGAFFSAVTIVFSAIPVLLTVGVLASALAVIQG